MEWGRFDPPLRVNQKELQCKAHVNAGEYQALEIRARLLPETLRPGEDKYRYHYPIPLNLLLIMIEIIFILICVHYSGALRQCTTYSNRLFFIPATSNLNKRPLAQQKAAFLSSII